MGLVVFTPLTSPKRDHSDPMPSECPSSCTAMSDSWLLKFARSAVSNTSVEYVVRPVLLRTLHGPLWARMPPGPSMLLFPVKTRMSSMVPLYAALLPQLFAGMLTVRSG